MKCRDCSEPATEGRSRCAGCRKKRKLYAKNYRQRLFNQGICYYCGTKPRVGNRGCCIDCLKKLRVATRKKATKDKLVVLAHYGLQGEVRCCWEGCNVTEIDGLTLDHIKDDGALQRKTNRRMGVMLYAYLIKQGFPKGFQTLCGTHQLIKKIQYERASRTVKDF